MNTTGVVETADATDTAQAVNTTDTNLTTLLAQYFPVWLDLTEEEQQALVRHARLARFEAGERVRDNRTPLGALLMLSGALRAYMLSEEGKQITLFRVNSQESCVLAASCALSMITFDVFLDALEESELLIIESAYYATLVEQNVYVEAFTYRQTAERFSDVMWVMEQVLFMSFDSRLAVFLLDEIARTKSDTLTLTHTEIADHLCSAREVVSRMLKRFAEEGMVSISRGLITVLDKDALRSLI